MRRRGLSRTLGGVNREQKKPFIGMLAGASLGLLAPTAGLLVTSLRVSQAFGHVAGVDPSMKASVLAKGISDAMNWTIAGIAFGLLGLIASVVSVVMFLRAGKH